MSLTEKKEISAIDVGGGPASIVTIESLDEEHWRLSILFFPTGDREAIRDSGIFHSLQEVANAIGSFISMMTHFSKPPAREAEECSPSDKPEPRKKRWDREIEKAIKKKLDN